MYNDTKIVMLVGHSNSSKIMYNSLKNDFNILLIVREAKISRKIFMQRRVENLGYIKVLGQIAFMVFNKILYRISLKKIMKLYERYHLNVETFPEDRIVDVPTINSHEVIKILKNIQPNIIIVNGTRIIKKEILEASKAIILNTHLGITPKYRGVHGAYWALVEDDKPNCGVTIHLVDKGIDTGGILYQDIITIGHNDNFNTYPVHQIAKAIPLMKQAIMDGINNKIIIKKRQDLVSKLWTHPTLFEYIKFRILQGIR